MNDANKKLNIQEEQHRACQALAAATLLLENGFLNDAVSKLYYFLLYNVRALLLTVGLEPRSHEGALRLFGLHFVKPGVFEPATSHLFSKAMKFREEADYNPSYVFSEEDVLSLKTDCVELSAAIDAYLKSHDFI